MNPDRILNHIDLALQFLPEEMTSDPARLFLLAIGLQESGLRYRRQMSGPARGYWQFERTGVTGVLSHHASKLHALRFLEALDYQRSDPTLVQAMLEFDVVLAAGIARLLLWTLPMALPHEREEGWTQYLEAWRPGKPRPRDWPGNWDTASSLLR